MAATARGGPVMQPHATAPSHNFAANKQRSLSNSYKNDHAKFQLDNLPFERPKKGDADYLWHSHGSTFARDGVEFQGKAYVRDPLSGSWFKDQPQRRREYNYTGCGLTMTVTEAKDDLGEATERRTRAMWAAPCGPAGAIWIQKSSHPHNAGMMAKQRVDNPVTRAQSMPSFLGSNGLLLSAALGSSAGAGAASVARQGPPANHAMAEKLPYARDLGEQRNALFTDCDPNGNGYCSFAEVSSVLNRKYGFNEDHKMVMLKAFNKTKNFSTKEKGPAASYVEKQEFRIFLELLSNMLGGNRESAAAAESRAKARMASMVPKAASSPTLSAGSSPGARIAKLADKLPYARNLEKQRRDLFGDCDPNGNGYCSFAEMQSVLNHKFGFGTEEKMDMLHAFDKARNFSGTQEGPAESYVQKKEFRVFLEMFAKTLKGKRLPALE